MLKKLEDTINNSLTLQYDVYHPFKDIIQYSDLSSSHIELSSWIASILKDTSQRPSAGDINRLFNAYQSPCPPSVYHLRDSKLLELFIRDAFASEQAISNIQEKFFLLAYASTASLDTGVL